MWHLVPVLQLAFFVAAAARPVNAKESDVVRVAVFDLDCATDVPGCKSGYLADLLRSGILGKGGQRVHLFTKENIQALLPPDVDLAECLGDCEVETARMLGADVVVSGRLTQSDDAIVGSIKVHRTSSGRLIAMRPIRADGRNELERRVSDAASAAVLAILPDRSPTPESPATGKNVSITSQSIASSGVDSGQTVGARGSSGFLGVRLEDTPKGPLVRGVVRGSSAERAGVKVGDRLVAVGPYRVANAAEVVRIVGNTAAKTSLALTVHRRDRFHSLQATLGRRVAAGATPKLGRTARPATGSANGVGSSRIDLRGLDLGKRASAISERQAKQLAAAKDLIGELKRRLFLPELVGEPSVEQAEGKWWIKVHVRVRLSKSALEKCLKGFLELSDGDETVCLVAGDREGCQDGGNRSIKVWKSTLAYLRRARVVRSAVKLTVDGSSLVTAIQRVCVPENARGGNTCHTDPWDRPITRGYDAGFSHGFMAPYAIVFGSKRYSFSRDSNGVEVRLGPFSQEELGQIGSIRAEIWPQ